jgi:Icc-related predicted phosphoesterase
MRITLISDTHTKHNEVTLDLPGGDLLIHAGDIMNSGRNPGDIQSFCEWFNGLDQYDHKVFIAGNHDRMFEDFPEKSMEIVNSYKWIDYLQDDWITVGDGDPHDADVKTAKIYGSPWQPEFHHWAFNLPRQGEELAAKWAAIPADTDILVTHGPAQGHLDASGPPYNEPNLGCPLLRNHIDQSEAKPKIHVCGHIHGGFGYKFDGHTHWFNASILNEYYEYVNKPVTFDWDPITNELTFINND